MVDKSLRTMLVLWFWVACILHISSEGIAARSLLQSSCPTKNEFTGRIAFGLLAEPGRYPYMVSLQNSLTDRHFCGGVLIAPDRVLTAAHCVAPESSGGDTYPSLAIGGLHLEDDPDMVKRTACRTIIHESWSEGHVDLGFDIAILELDKACEKKSIGLVQQGAMPKTKSRVLGWGLDENGDLPAILQELDMEVITAMQCKAAKSLADVALDGIMCAEIAGADVCNGDSGGPLLNPGAGCGENDILIGLTSFGLKCSQNEGLKSPGAFTSVAQYLSWIKVDGAKDRVVYENPDCEIKPLPEDPTERIPLAPLPTEVDIRKPAKCGKSGVCIKLRNNCADESLQALVRYKMEDGWVVGGWWTVEPGAVVPVVSNAMPGPAYFYAESENGNYRWGKDSPFTFDGKELNFTKASLKPRFSSFTWHFDCNASARKGCGFDRYCIRLKNKCDVGIRALIRTKQAGKWAVRGWFFLRPGKAVLAVNNAEDQRLFVHAMSATGKRTWDGPHTFKFDGEDKGFKRVDMGPDFNTFTWTYLCS